MRRPQRLFTGSGELKVRNFEASDVAKLRCTGWQNLVGNQLSPFVLEWVSRLSRAICLVSENGNGEISGYLVALVRTKNGIPVGETLSCGVAPVEKPLGVASKLWLELERVCEEKQVLLIPEDHLVGSRVG